MIEKIFNWTMGSFFRTLGRFLFYIVIGILVFFAFAWFKEAHALTYNLEVGNATYYLCTPTGCGTKTGKTDYLHDSSSLTYNQAFYKFSVPFQTISSDSPDLNPGLFPGQYLIEFYVFSNNGIMNTNYCYQLSSNFKNINMTTGNLVSDEINSSCVDMYRTTYLGVNAYRILYKFDYTGDYATEFVFDLNSSPNDFFANSPNIGVFGISLGNISTYSTDLVDAFKNDKNSQIITSQNQQVIEQNQTIINQNTQTNEKLDDLNENITSDEIDTSSSDSFFSNFSSEDNGGISGVVTAPLRFVQKLTDACEPLSFDLFGKTISIPCGDEIFWNREDVQGFRITWNILLGGPIIYALMLWLFKVINNLKDPENSKVEVMKL